MYLLCSPCLPSLKLFKRVWKQSSRLEFHRPPGSAENLIRAWVLGDLGHLLSWGDQISNGELAFLESGDKMLGCMAVTFSPPIIPCHDVQNCSFSVNSFPLFPMLKCRMCSPADEESEKSQCGFPLTRHRLTSWREKNNKFIFFFYDDISPSS